MNREDAPDGSYISLTFLVGQLKASVNTLMETNYSNDQRAEVQRQLLHDKFDALRDDVHSLKSDVKDVQQDVAEMREDQKGVKTRLEVFNNEHLREQGWWDVIKRIGGAGWAAIAAVSSALVFIFMNYLKQRYGDG